MRLLLTRGAAVIGGLALSLTAGASIASADPAEDAIVNTNCSYAQFVSALTAVNPEAKRQLDEQPDAQGYFQTFLAAPPGGAQRVQYAQMFKQMPTADTTFPVLQQAFGVCNKY
jgi:hemophore-related protein